MAKFTAIRDNYGYMNRYWRKGDVVEADALPNAHFKEDEEKKARKSKVKKPVSDWKE